MDKVTQTTAANAEESAAAAEELNAQALSMTEAVSDLARLIGGGAQTVNADTGLRAHSRAQAPAKAPAKMPKAPTQSAKKAAATFEVTPQRQTSVAERRGEIPLEDLFKNF
jgi:methyl-accepting chemotaxis protein